MPQRQCTNCNVRDICLLANVAQQRNESTDTTQPVLNMRTISIRRGDRLFSQGQTGAIYAVRLGFFKTRILNSHLREQVTGFYMPGALMGADALALGQHGDDAVALEDGEACEISCNTLVGQAQKNGEARQQLQRILGQEISRLHHTTQRLRDTVAVQRVVGLLLDLSDAFALRGYSARSFLLRMTRNEMASYLGLSIETVSRILSRLQNHGLLQIQGKLVNLTDTKALHGILEQTGNTVELE
ncbi:helix-turn-helix domain-containing protein [Silvimonas amylolytica]|uniref:helix-turn-helix domain-containing protein n=1 Tax=Silvimonas amylolytica TaxID=449663 RepID=UPI001E54A8B3|nr:helix-turn-helix domain-containing protein [Silvimonas amylolytica]